MNRIPVIGLVLLSSCASMTRSERAVYSAAVGGAAGGTAGVLLSPNRESRALNGAVFGLTGALVGAIGSLFFGPDEPEPLNTSSSFDLKNESNRKAFSAPTTESLPEFVKRRFRPAVIEEYVEADSIGEDGSLREPHKVYRIKRPAELIARPISDQRKKQNTGEQNAKK